MLIALVHMLVPHEHVHNLNSPEHISQHKKAESIVDFLTLGFQHEQYEGQMEHFDSNDEVDLALDLLPVAIQLAIINNVDVPSLVRKDTNSHFERSVQICEELSITVNSYRGPPSLLV